MNVPTEADGWRVVKDPLDPRPWYWRCRAFELEYNYWELGRWRSEWRSLGTVHDSVRESRQAFFAELFLNP